MIYFQQLLAAISLLQAPEVFFNLGEDEDPTIYLNVLSSQIEAITGLVSSTLPQSWEKYAKDAEEAKQEDSNNLLANFNSLIADVFEFGTNVTGAEECTISFKHIQRADILKAGNYSAQNDTFINLQRLAIVEMIKLNEQLKYLQAEYEASCGDAETNCEGTSKNVIAEVERLLPKTHGTGIVLAAEELALAYELIVDRWSVHAYIASHLDSVVQNITACIASKIEGSTLEPSNTTFKQSNRAGSISDSYSKLVSVSQDALLKSQRILLTYQTSVGDQSNKDYLSNIANIRNVTYLANQTINSLHNAVPVADLSQSCARPDVQPVLDSSVSRALQEYTDAGVNTVSFIFRESINNIKVTVDEMLSIGMQVDGCSGDTTCDYLKEKINRKIIEIPSTTRIIAKSGAVLMYQSVSAVRKSGYNIARGVLERLGVDIVNFKACIREVSYL